MMCSQEVIQNLEVANNAYRRKVDGGGGSHNEQLAGEWINSEDKAKTIDSMAFGPQWRHSKFVEDADAVSYSQLSVIHRIDH